ncbi:MAG: Flp pilus assembly pilin Flp [Limisphaerales bacterium]|jgi:Flp pilus assembly pilin Flp
MKLYSIHPSLSSGPAPRRSESAFTMVEVALSLGIVAFALVAIIGILPVGLKAQQQNREDTIIAQDGVYLMEAIRAGIYSSNLNVLTQNLVFLYVTNSIPLGADRPVRYETGTSFVNPAEVIMQMSRPSFDSVTFTSNKVFAVFRGFNGNLSELVPDPNLIRFQYRVDVELEATSSGIGITNYATSFLSSNLYNLTLTYRWPADERGNVIGLGKRVLRTQVSGTLNSYELTNGALNAIVRNSTELADVSLGKANKGYFLEPVFIGR